MKVSENFLIHISAVEKLMNFDRDVLDAAISQIRSLKDKLIQHHKLDNPSLTADNTLKILEGIREHDSLRSRYNTIFNQALVLLVSYFAASVHDLFRQGICEALKQDNDSKLLKEQIRITFGELKEANYNLHELAPDLLIQLKDISFQDTQSIKRSFSDYLEIEIEKTGKVNDIILGQACRHVIVHSGGVVDDKLIRQVSNATPRQVKTTIVQGEQIQFTDSEVMHIAESMRSYINELSDKVYYKYKIND